MERFSEKYGFKQAKSKIQLESIDSELRNGLWNALHLFYWTKGEQYESFDSPYNREAQHLCSLVWLNYFKLPIDEMPHTPSSTVDHIRSYFFSCPWFEVYDIVQFIANNYSDESVNANFMNYCNQILEREVSAYRFVGGRISPLVSEQEIMEIEEAIDSRKSPRPVAIHLKTALDMLSDRKSPDYRNSIKEAISSVEALCKMICNDNKATLGKAIAAIGREGKVTIHPSLLKSFESLYGYTSEADGIRHALLDEPNLDFEDAKFMLVCCSAFVNYLRAKSFKAGIDLSYD